MIYAQYDRACTVNLLPSGLIMNPKYPWHWCSQNWKAIDCNAVSRGKNLFGLLEIKVVKEGEHTYDNVVCTA